MVLELVKNTAKYTIFLGLIGLFIHWAFGLQNSFATETVINGQKILIFSWQGYIEKLQDAWSTNALNFDDLIPPGSFVEIQGFIFDSQFWEALGNNLKYFFNWIIFIPNFIAYITRWMAWIFRLALALIGWDFSMTNGVYNSSLVRSMTWITQYLVIPYIQ